MNNLELLEQELADAEKAPAPVVEKILSTGDDGKSLPTAISSISGNDYVWIYDTKTHERSKTTKNMLATQLRKIRPDGSRIFTTSKPKEQPVRGSLKCMLHPDDPNRSHYDELGFAICNKNNLTSPYQVKRHMQKKHKDEYAAIVEEKALIEKAEEKASKERERNYMEGLAKAVNTEPMTEKVYMCEVCGEEFTSKVKLKEHKKEHK